MRFRLLAPITSLAILVGMVLCTGIVEARSLSYSEYNVTLDVHSDSTVDVTQNMQVLFSGEYRGVLLGITLNDPNRDAKCASGGKACGGFNFIKIMGVYDGRGELVPESEYEVNIESYENGHEYMVVKWEVWPDGRNFDGKTEFGWTVKYKLLGSLGFDSQDRPLVYWNALPEDRGGPVKEAVVTLNLPPGVSAASDLLNVYLLSARDVEVDTSFNSIVTKVSNLTEYEGALTVEYLLPKGSVAKPSTINFTHSLPWWFDLYVKLDDLDLGQAAGIIPGVPSGKHTLEFSYPGYVTKSIRMDVPEAQSMQIDATLSPSPILVPILLLNVALLVLGVAVIPLAIFWVYRSWSHKGRDAGVPAAIIPIYHPPKGVSPYLLGSVKDEKVDAEDITGTIIDLAYRGFIKIKEIKKNTNYQLTKVASKAELQAVEQQLMEDIFGADDEVETKDLGASFYRKYVKLKKKIEQEMVEKGYFTELPSAVRAKYMGVGLGLLFLGLAACVFLVLIGVLIGMPGPFTLGIALTVAGVAYLVVSFYMPAKTAAGGKLLGEILGFRMYMYHAERYRLQDLQPEEFERYLGYAIVFGIEKQWAEKFKDIYKVRPDWYEGSNAVWDAYWVSQFGRGFSNSMHSVALSPARSGTGSGSGWSSGSSSFGGGFSGGGGGGGFSGGF